MKQFQTVFASGNYAVITFNDISLKIDAPLPMKDAEFIELGCKLISTFSNITAREAEGLKSLVENYLKSKCEYAESKEIRDEDLFGIANASSDELYSAMRQLLECYRAQSDYELRLNIDEVRLLKDLVGTDNPDYAPLRKKLGELL